jgi:hypothetical protein
MGRYVFQEQMMNLTINSKNVNFQLSRAKLLSQSSQNLQLGVINQEEQQCMNWVIFLLDWTLDLLHHLCYLKSMEM